MDEPGALAVALVGKLGGCPRLAAVAAEIAAVTGRTPLELAGPRLDARLALMAERLLRVPGWAHLRGGRRLPARLSRA